MRRPSGTPRRNGSSCGSRTVGRTASNRIGQKGRTTHVWYQRGRRPRGLREQRFASVQLFGAVCPERGAGVALALAEVSTGAMTLFLAELARVVPAGTHAVCSSSTGPGGT